ncbi:hypothetical protein ACFV9C_27345 [Kribbella sp. NPDC059898]
MASYGKDNKVKSGGKTEKKSGSKSHDMPVLYPAGHRPKGKDGKGTSR